MIAFMVEQELSLDQTIELFNGIRSHFLPPNAPPELAAGFETSSFDVEIDTLLLKIL